MLAATLLFAWATLWRCPETPIGRFLNRWLVERAAALIDRIERKHLIFILVALFVAQGFAMVGMPELAVVAAWDVSTYLDLLLLAWTLTAIAGVRTAWRMAINKMAAVAPRIGQGRARSRSRRTRPASARAEPANEDDHPAWTRLAA